MVLWSPHDRMDVVAMERQGRRFSKILLRLVDFCYRDKLDRLGLFSLKQRKSEG